MHYMSLQGRLRRPVTGACGAHTPPPGSRKWPNWRNWQQGAIVRPFRGQNDQNNPKPPKNGPKWSKTPFYDVHSFWSKMTKMTQNDPTRKNMAVAFHPTSFGQGRTTGILALYTKKKSVQKKFSLLDLPCTQRKSRSKKKLHLLDLPYLPCTQRKSRSEKKM